MFQPLRASTFGTSRASDLGALWMSMLAILWVLNLGSPGAFFLFPALCHIMLVRACSCKLPGRGCGIAFPILVKNFRMLFCEPFPTFTLRALGIFMLGTVRAYKLTAFCVFIVGIICASTFWECFGWPSWDRLVCPICPVSNLTPLTT